ncbi:MAG TPA: FAD-binding oxidoreductase [Candidatus Paceibacterota bacterium]
MEIKDFLQGEIVEGSLETYEHDASIFEVKPSLVVRPKNSQDVEGLVKFVSERKSAGEDISLTARAAGSDMSGGPLSDSIIVDFGKLNKISDIDTDLISVEPGVFYRDFEIKTLENGLLLPSYPASKDLCMVGGMVANNSGGEKSLKYGKTDRYVKELRVVLSDGEEYSIVPLSAQELEEKKTQTDFEGKIYRETYELLQSNYEKIQEARPTVSKNSAGYALWNVWDGKIFDLTKLFTGSQGTLGLITGIKFKLIKPAKLSKILVIFLKDLNHLVGIVDTVMGYNPESFESYDKHTLKLAMRFMPEIIAKMKGNGFALAFSFLPELGMVLSGGLPELVLLAEFTGDDGEILGQKLETVKKDVDVKFKVRSRIASSSADAQKYWTIRRESFNLLRKHVQGKKSAPFIDDIIVARSRLGEFLPRLQSILGEYKELTYTIAGHVGDANFHIIPLMNLSDQESHETIRALSDRVYSLVVDLGGSITAEHNDGLIRTPFLEKMYGPEVYDIFVKIKKIFDPLGIFNPRKKVGGDIEYSMKHIKVSN